MARVRQYWNMRDSKGRFIKRKSVMRRLQRAAAKKSSR